MQEKRIIELLTRKLAGEATADELVELKDLVYQNPDFLDTEEEFRKIWKANTDNIDDDFYYKRHIAKYKENIIFDNAGDSIPIHRNTNGLRYFYYVAAILIVVIITGAVFFYNYYPVAKQPGISKMIEISAPSGVRKLVTLPDSSTVWLNAGSTIFYNAAMVSESTRNVELVGEAYFDIAHDETHPFFIKTNKVLIKVLGTAFNVKAYPGEKRCITTLIRGSIELSVNDDAKQKFILKPFEQIAVVGNTNSNSNTILKTTIVASEKVDKKDVKETSWINNKLVFENESLEELSPKLERWYNVKITIKNKTAASYKYTGAFTKETIEQALTVMKLIKPFNFTSNNQNITIY